MRWTFLDYVDANGANRIEAWLRELSPRMRVKIQSKLVWMLNNADVLGLGGLEAYPRFESLHGQHSGLIAMRFNVRIVYRPLCCYGPDRGEFTLLAGATEHNDIYRPPGILETALARREEVLADRRRAVPTCLFQEIS